MYSVFNRLAKTGSLYTTLLYPPLTVC